MDHAGIDTAVLRGKLFREFAVGVVLIPVPRLGKDQALGNGKPERLHIGDEHQ